MGGRWYLAMGQNIMPKVEILDDFGYLSSYLAFNFVTFWYFFAGINCMIHLDTEQSRNPLAFPGRRSMRAGMAIFTVANQLWLKQIGKPTIDIHWLVYTNQKYGFMMVFNHIRDSDAKRQDVSRLLIHLEDAQPSGLSGSPRSLLRLSGTLDTLAACGPPSYGSFFFPIPYWGPLDPPMSTLW